jgi:glucuronate isomerase
MNAGDPAAFRLYATRLGQVSGIPVSNYHDYLMALKSRHDFFHDNGCRVSDHGLEEIYAEEFQEEEIVSIFEKLLQAEAVDNHAQRKFKSAMLIQFAEWDHAKGWVQQFHLGAIRNNNTRMMKVLGPDTGWDSIGTFDQAKPLAKFLNRLDTDNKLAKTIIYNLNPADNEVMASMIGNFNDGSMPGKVQHGSAWWFLDQKDGMIRQMNALSNMGLLSKFVGMLTDSRSFLSFPRHEYFRRLLCDLLGDEVEKGELPHDLDLLGNMVKDICYTNNKTYFGWPL